MPQDGRPFIPGSGLPPDLDPRSPRRRDRSGEVRSGAALGGRIVAALLSLAVLVGSGVAWARYRQFQSDIVTVQAISKAKAPKKDIDGKDQNILITGNDDRSTASAAELAQLGTTTDGGSLNTDTMMLLHVPANGKKASAISFPRDSWVNVPGHGMSKLNSAYTDGVTDNKGNKSAGAQLLVQTLENLTGLTIDHYVQIDLLGFYRISKAIKGVTVCLNQAQGPATRVGQEGVGFDSGYEPNGTWVSSYTHIDLKKGNNTIQGLQALAFVRQRHGLPGGDLDRIVRQQYFLSAVFRKVTSAGTLLNPIKLNDLLTAVSSSLQIDGNSAGHTGLDPLKLAQQMQNLTAGNLSFTTIPTTSDTIDGLSVQVVDTTGMQAQIAKLIGTTVPSAYAKAKVVSPSTVTVAVLNGNGGSGVAGTNAGILKQVGFKTTTGDTSSTPSTVIRYPAGMEAQAKTLAQYVHGAAVQATSSVTGVTLVLGTDGKTASVSTKAPATTTAPTATTSVAPVRTAAQTDCIN